MKYPIILLLAILSLFACTNTAPNSSQTTNEPTDTGGSQDDPDLVAITDVIHNFYKWYDGSIQTLEGINYVNYGGKHLTLDNAKMDAYFAQFAKSGYISNEYIDSEKAYLKKCEAEWQKEPYEDGPPTGLDANRFFCAQDWDINFWTTAPVSVEKSGTDRVKATMAGTVGDYSQEQKFELKKENGKWLISRIECEM